MNRTSKVQKVLFLVIFMLSTTSFDVQHKFYLSVTQVSHSEKDAAVQIITRVFIDDMNAVLTERYGIEAHLGGDMEEEIDRDYLEKYLRTKFVVGVNGVVREYDLLGTAYDADMLVCYLEVAELPLEAIESIAITNEVLTDLFDDQQNVVHFNVGGKKKSFVLLKSNPKGMLKL